MFNTLEGSALELRLTFTMFGISSMDPLEEI